MWVRCLPAALAACAAVPAGPAPSSDVPVADDAERRGRGAWVVAEIARWNAYLSDDDRADKYRQLAASPVDFFRGTNHLFWADNGRRADLAFYGVDIWLSGDLHSDNLGSFT